MSEEDDKLYRFALSPCTCLGCSWEGQVIDAPGLECPDCYSPVGIVNTDLEWKKADVRREEGEK